MATCSALTPNLNLHKPGEHHLYHPGDSLRPCLILVWYPKTHSAVEPYGKPAGSLRPGGTLCLLLRCLRPVLEAVSLSSPCGLSHIPPSPAQAMNKDGFLCSSYQVAPGTSYTAADLVLHWRPPHPRPAESHRMNIPGG